MTRTCQSWFPIYTQSRSESSLSKGNSSCKWSSINPFTVLELLTWNRWWKFLAPLKSEPKVRGELFWKRKKVWLRKVAKFFKSLYDGRHQLASTIKTSVKFSRIWGTEQPHRLPIKFIYVLSLFSRVIFTKSSSSKLEKHVEGSIRQPVIHGSALKTRTKQFQIRENFKMTHFLKMLRSQEEKHSLVCFFFFSFWLKTKQKRSSIQHTCERNPFFVSTPKSNKWKERKVLLAGYIGSTVPVSQNICHSLLWGSEYL